MIIRSSCKKIWIETGSMFMKKFLFFLTLLFYTGLIFGLQVNTDELKNAREVQFINYEGPSAKKDSSFAVRYIGTRLSRVKEPNRVFPYFLK